MILFGRFDRFGVGLGKIVKALVGFVFRNVAEAEGFAAGTVAFFSKSCEVAVPPPFRVWTLLGYRDFGGDGTLQGLREVSNRLVKVLDLEDLCGWGEGSKE